MLVFPILKKGTPGQHPSEHILVILLGLRSVPLGAGPLPFRLSHTRTNLSYTIVTKKCPGGCGGCFSVNTKTPTSPLPYRSAPPGTNLSYTIGTKKCRGGCGGCGGCFREAAHRQSSLRIQRECARNNRPSPSIHTQCSVFYKGQHYRGP